MKQRLRSCFWLSSLPGPKSPPIPLLAINDEHAVVLDSLYCRVSRERVVLRGELVVREPFCEELLARLQLPLAQRGARNSRRMLLLVGRSFRGPNGRNRVVCASARSYFFEEEIIYVYMSISGMSINQIKA